ncbi:M1 family aminopeptidase [Bacteroidota bacterium]
MKRISLPIAIVLLPLLSLAGIPDHDCSGHRAFALKTVPTHVQDSALLLYDVNHYGISLEVSDTSTYISGFTDIKATALEQIEELVFELKTEMHVDSILVGGKKLKFFTHEFDLIRCTPDNPVKKDELFNVRVYYNGLGGHGGFFSGISNRTDMQWGNRVTYTLSEPFASRDWFVCKQVLNDKADSADIWLTVGEGLMAGSNGMLVKIDSIKTDKLRFHWQTRYPIAYYLLSLSVSNYQDYSFYIKPESIPDSILIQNYIYNVPGHLELLKDDIDATADLIHLYSGIFSEYPFWKEKYGHCLAPMGGGMEHQTMTTLSSFRFNLVAHELTHQWFGDNVTCASWQDIWVNEGFASYGEYLAQEALISRQAADLWMQNAHEFALSEPMGSVYIPLEDASDVFRIFSTTLSYKKGASLLHMIRYELDNDSLFFETLSRFTRVFSDSVATGMDFMNILNDVSGSDFNWFFDQWYFGQGFPEFGFTWWQTVDSLIIEVNQFGSSSETPFFRTSMDFSLQLENGRDTAFRTFIDKPSMRIGLSIFEPVTALVHDPENWVLDKSQVIKKVISNGYFSVNPNPFGDELNIVFQDDTGEKEITLCDLSGKILNKLRSSSQKITLNTHDLNQGLYLLQVKEGKDTYTTRIVRQ